MIFAYDSECAHCGAYMLHDEPNVEDALCQDCEAKNTAVPNTDTPFAICNVCSDWIWDEPDAVLIPAIGYMHSDDHPDCKPTGLVAALQENRKKRERVVAIRDRFKRQGILHADDCVWLLEYVEDKLL